jgi:hypothetical protein
MNKEQMKEKFSKLSTQAQNCLRELYNRANPASIKMAFSMQVGIRDEMAEFFGTQDDDELAIRCSTYWSVYGN